MAAADIRRWRRLLLDVDNNPGRHEAELVKALDEAADRVEFLEGALADHRAMLSDLHEAVFDDVDETLDAADRAADLLSRAVD